jgi:hypothetical protein
VGAQDFAAPGREHPAPRVRLLHNRVCSLGDTARRLTSEVRALAA